MRECLKSRITECVLYQIPGFPENVFFLTENISFPVSEALETRSYRYRFTNERICIIDMQSKTRPVSSRQFVSFVAASQSEYVPPACGETSGNWASEGCGDSREIKRARLSAPSNGPLFVYALWSRSLPFIRSPCTGRKSQGLVCVAFQGKRWPSSSWNDWGGNAADRKTETGRQGRKAGRKWDDTRRHSGPTVGTILVNASKSRLLQRLPITHRDFAPSPAEWHLGHMSWKTSPDNCACSTCHKPSNVWCCVCLPLSVWGPKRSRDVTMCAEVMCSGP